MTATTHLALPLMAAAQAEKHVTHNEALLALDALIHCAVLDKDLSAPPGSPAEGDRYIVAASPTGAWAGKAGQIAVWRDGVWQFHPPKPGFVVFVIDEASLYTYVGAAWTAGVPLAALQNLALFGLGTTADATNPFSAKLNKALWVAKTAAEGGDGDLRYTLNKETAADVLSFVLQRGFSGRAEIGLIGDDDLAIKVSADGAAWTEALRLRNSDGRATFAGAALLPAGAVGAPSLAGAADTDTGLWFQAADTLALSTGGAERVRLDSAGRVGLQGGIISTSARVTCRFTDAAHTALQLYGQNDSYAASLILMYCDRTPGTGFNYLQAWSDQNGTPDQEFRVDGSGATYGDNAYSVGADYAEFFEWADGNPQGEDRRGVSVALDGAMIRPAAGADYPSAIIGVVSVNPTVVGDSAWKRWSGKYLTDEFGAPIEEDYEAVEWADGERAYSHAADKLPRDVAVPADAKRTMQRRRKLNPAYDPGAAYVPRAERREWDAIGLMGKLRLRKGQPTGERWIKLRTLSATLDEWLVR